jgi:hypothetical protein
MKTMTLEEIIEANQDAGLHFFDDETMQFFRSEVVSEPRHGNNDWHYFITEDATGFDHRNTAFTIRAFNPDNARVNTIGEFLAYATLQDAQNALDEILANQLGGENER